MDIFKIICPFFYDMTIEAVIFDKDGILVETEWAHYESYRKAVWEIVKLELPLKLYVEYGVSRNYKEFLRDAFGEKLNLSLYDQIHNLKRRYYAEFRKQGFKPVDGIKDLIQRLYGHYRLAIASTTSVESICEDLESVGIQKSFFELLKSGKDGDVKNNKPAPDIYLRIAEILGVNPSNCIVLEDGKNGILAAKNAGMICIARSYDFTPGKSDKEKEEYLKEAGAKKVIKSYSEITVQMIDSFVNQ